MTEREAVEHILSLQHTPPPPSLNEYTTAAYSLRYPTYPEPDFYDSEHAKYIEAWVRIRELVQYFLYRPKGGSFAPNAPYDAPMPLKTKGIPFASGDPEPAWPVISSDARGCMLSYIDVYGGTHGTPFQGFIAPRGLKRYHIGHDCIANHLDVVVAPEDGVVVKINEFVGDTDAVWIHTDTNLTLILGETEPGSPASFGVGVGSEVEKGQPVARVGTFGFAQTMKMHMVHFETHQGLVTDYSTYLDKSNLPGKSGPPPALRNPTDYLLRAACSVEMKLGMPSMPSEALEDLGDVVMGTNFRH